MRTLIRWAGDNPERAGMIETPKRVVKAYEEFFAGYREDPAAILAKTFEDIVGYDDFVLVKNIDFTSHCEHHIVPIVGQAHVAYWPEKRSSVSASWPVSLIFLQSVWCRRRI